MKSPCDQKITKLREKNRALLDQLESNSILLERRLKKLKRTARTTKCSDKLWQDLPVSSLKRKYESWKARNYSGQVSAALNASVYNCTHSSSDTSDVNASFKQRMEDITSPAKRSKKNALIVSRSRNKEVKPCKSCQNSLKSSTAIELLDDEKECADCYSKEHVDIAQTLVDLTPQEDEISVSPTQTGNNYEKVKESSDLHSVKHKIEGEIVDSEQQTRTLEAAHALINYSPESLFLRRLKERSQAIGNLIAPGNIRRTTAKSNCITSCKASPLSAKSIIRSNSKRTAKKSPCNIDKSVSAKSVNSVRDDADHDSDIQIFNEDQQHMKEQFLGCSSRYSPKEQSRRLKKDRKRVCYRKHCYCRIPQNTEFRKRFYCNTKENMKEESVKQVHCNPEHSSSSCEENSVGSCGCQCEKHPLLESDAVAGLVDNEQDKKYVYPRCCSNQGSSLFDELNEFRQSHWFDCHAHQHSPSTNLESARNKGTCQCVGHKCTHRYVLDDRLFAKPLHADHHNKSRCITCHLPYNKSREIPPITIPSTLQDPEIQVSIPLRSPHGVRHYPATSGNVLSHKKTTQSSNKGKAKYCSPRVRSQSSLFTHTLGDLKPQPQPAADSLALRFQKGVTK